MTDELTTKILVEIRDAVRENGRRIEETNERLDAANERLDATNERLDDTNQRLSILATLTRSIDGRVAKLEDRDTLFLPQRVQRLEADRDDHAARLAALEEA